MKMPWPVVNDAFLTALVLQGLIAIAGHFVSILGRHFSAASVVISALMGFIFGVWANPTPLAVAALGGVLVAGGSTLIGAAIALLLGDVKAATLIWVTIGSAGAGALAAAIGSVVGRSIFGS